MGTFADGFMVGENDGFTVGTAASLKKIVVQNIKKS